MGPATTPLRSCSPYEEALGSAFGSLHAEVRCAHLAPLIARGTMDVTHGTHWLTPLLVALMTLPPAGPAQAVRLEVRAADGEVLWMRRIGRTVLRTRQRAVGSRIVEHHGVGDVTFDLAIDNGSLLYRQVSMTVVGLVIPACMRPAVQAKVSPAAAGWQVEVVVTWRRRLVCRYAGQIEAA